MNIKHGMEIYANSADPAVVKRLLDLYPLDGVTTNPELVAQVKRDDYFGLIKELRSLVGEKNLFVQVTAQDYDTIIREAEAIREAAGKDTIVKIGCSPEGIKAIRDLTKAGVRTLGTQVMSAMQGIMALQAGAEYIAPFYGCMNEAGVNGKLVFESLVKYREVSGCRGQILGCAPFNQDEVAWMFGTGITAITLMPWDFDDGVENEAFKKLAKGVYESWEKQYGQGSRIYDLKK